MGPAANRDAQAAALRDIYSRTSKRLKGCVQLPDPEKCIDPRTKVVITKVLQNKSNKPFVSQRKCPTALRFMADRLSSFNSSHSSETKYTLVRLQPALEDERRKSPVSLERILLWTRVQMAAMAAFDPKCNSDKTTQLPDIILNSTAAGRLSGLAQSLSMEFCSPHDNEVINQILLGAIKYILHFHIAENLAVGSADSRIRHQSTRNPRSKSGRKVARRQSIPTLVQSSTLSVPGNASAPVTTQLRAAPRKGSRDQGSSSSDAAYTDDQRPQKKLCSAPPEKNGDTVATTPDTTKRIRNPFDSSSDDSSSSSDSDDDQVSQSELPASTADNIVVNVLSTSDDNAHASHTSIIQAAKSQKRTIAETADDLYAGDSEQTSRKSKKNSKKASKEAAIKIEDSTSGDQHRAQTSAKQSKEAKKSRFTAAETQPSVQNESVQHKQSRSSSKMKAKKGKGKSTGAKHQTGIASSSDHAPVTIQASQARVVQSPPQTPAAATSRTQQLNVKQEHDIHEISSDDPDDQTEAELQYSSDEGQSGPAVPAQPEYITDKNGKTRKKGVQTIDVYRDIVEERNKQIKDLKNQRQKDVERQMQALEQ